MAAALARTSRTAARLLSSQMISAISSRGYAEEMNFTFAAANQVFYANANVRQVDVPSFSGSFGILPKHVPTLAVLKPGVVTVYENDGTAKKVFVSSGTVTINEDSSVQVLAEEAHYVENLDTNAAREQLRAAQSSLATAANELDKAIAEIEVEVAESLILASG
ncbi:ATP synthase, delta subunit [Lycorma delicatula]|uniref:ATP synthase, delta subunit n=1 Tax=Lycorma delicatula TaxID=130591 RepID=UPI003F514DF4